MSRRIMAITGWGVVCASGVGSAAFADAVATGGSSIGEVLSFDPDGLGFERAAEIEEFDVAPYLRSPKNFLDRNSQLAFAACEMAVRDSGVELPPTDDEKPGLSFGSGSCNLTTLAMFRDVLLSKGPKLVPPFVFPHTYPNTTASLLSIEYGLGGPHMAFTSGGAASGQALAYGGGLIREGRCDLLLAGGAEAFSEALCRGARAAGWLSTSADGREGCRPFDSTRNGTVLGEGAAMFALESESRVRSRAAKPRAWVTGSAMSSNAADSMSRALGQAGVESCDIDLIVAAAGGYRDLDAEEANAIREVIGGHGALVLAPKAAFGETFGASGALNLAVALVAMERGIPPANRPGGDSAPGHIELSTETRGAEIRNVLVNAAHPDGGAWVSLAVSRNRVS